MLDFLTNVRTAAGFLAPRVLTDPDPGRVSLPDAAKRADVWLTPRSVAGYEPDDFLYSLDADRRAELTASVERFREVAERIPADRPATADEVREAVGPFLATLALLRPYHRPEWLRAYDALSEIRFPPAVIGYTHDVGRDWFDEQDVIRVWVTLDDDAIPADDAGLSAVVRPIEGLVRHAIRTHGLPDLLLFSIRARSEMPEVIGCHGD